MSLRTKESFTEKLLARLTDLEPMFTMSPGAAAELFGFNPQRAGWRAVRYRREKEQRERKRIAKAFENLCKADYITVVKGKRGEYQVSPKGWLKFAMSYAKHFKASAATKKQGGFLIVFDIPEQHRQFRDVFRRVLYSLGFSQFQRSVFYTSDHKAFEFAARIIVNCELEDRAKLVFADKIV
ncbi:MAG: hypothetical protein AB1352_04230 [Patescibacteria group bacterium]